MPISLLKFHFLQINFFSAVITRTHHLPTHTPFFRPIMCKKRALHLFLKITFFCSLLLLLTPEILPNHLFRQTNHQKKFIFFIIYFTFSLSPYGKNKTNYFFPLFLSPEIGKSQGKTVVLKKIFFFFFFFNFFPPYRSS